MCVIRTDLISQPNNVLRQAVERQRAMFDLPKFPGFRAAHPREEHFVPIYVAAGAGHDGSVKILHGGYGIHTIAFGL